VREPPADPRLTFPTHFRNVRPGAKFVGDAACAGCHRSIAESYAKHPMGRSAEWVGRAPSATDHAAGANSSFTSAGYALRVERRADGVWHCVGLLDGGAAVPEYAVRADLAIGSGRRGRSYLSVDRGAVWQSPISWFGQAEKWDVSPGFDLAKELRRPVVPRCLGCHTDQPRPVPDSLNRYAEPLLPTQASIGCERCHGPGEVHVAEHSSGAGPRGPDDSIVNPARLPAELKADICRQCHLQGAVQVARRGRDAAEYRPGLPWELFVTTFLWHPGLTDLHKSVGQFEQMEASRCFAGSGGRLGCTTCHDPHAKPAAGETGAYFRAKCLSCHESRGCSLPPAQRRERKDSCVACHMPAQDSSNVAHVAVTDHRIPRRPAPTGPRVKSLPPGEAPLVAYRPGPHAPDPAERARDAAIALGDEFARVGGPPEAGRRAEAELERLLLRWPDDAPAWLTRSRVRAALGDGSAALDAARSAVALNPGSEVALTQLAGAAVAAQEFDAAVEATGKLIALNPSSADHRLTRATAYFSSSDWAKAEADCREALTIQPVRGNARFMLAVCLHKRGDAVGARREFDLALKLTPGAAMRRQLTQWYGELTR
jgi:Tfp pilus assembly protein PilF